MSRIDILMYHSISRAGGPTSIAPEIFRAQMEAIEASGLPVIGLDALAAARQGGPALPERALILTFDDGFADFAATAWPEIARRGWPVTVYLPTGFIGGVEGWRGIASPPRPLMGWDEIAALAREGVDFGGHSVSHPDLDALAPQALEAELAGCRDEIAARTGKPPAHFAPPYGSAGPAVRAAVARHYATSCSTRLGQAGAQDDLHDLPRLEMFYFTDPARWRAHLAGRGGAYLARRRVLRRIRGLVLKPWG